MDPDVNTLTYEIGDGVLREVQETCFTPRQTIKRSPPIHPLSTPSNKPSSVDSDNTRNPLMTTSHANSSTGDGTEITDAIPPQRCWEIPRTPVTNLPHSSVQYQQFQVQLSTGQTSKKSTPVRVKTHPLSRSSKAGPRRRDMAAELDQTNSDNGQSNTAIHGVSPAPLPEERKATISPPISVAKGRL